MAPNVLDRDATATGRHVALSSIAPSGATSARQRRRARFSVRRKLYTLCVPLAVSCSVLAVASVLPYRAIQRQLEVGRTEVTAALDAQRFVRHSSEMMLHLASFVLTSDDEHAGAVRRSRGLALAALEAWTNDPHTDSGEPADVLPLRSSFLALGPDVDRTVALVQDGAAVAAVRHLYEVVMPRFDDDVAEPAAREAAHERERLTEAFIHLAGEAGRAEPLLGGKLPEMVLGARIDVEQSLSGAAYTQALVVQGQELIEILAGADSDTDGLWELRAEARRHLDAWTRTTEHESGPRASSERAQLARVLEVDDQLEEAADAALAAARAADDPGGLANVFARYGRLTMNQLETLDDLIDAEDAEFADSALKVAGRAHQIEIAMLAFAGGIFIAGIVAVVLIARRLARRIERLGGAAQRIGSGDLKARVTDETHDEVGDLAHTFNRMAERLSDTRRQLAGLIHRTVEATEHERTRLAAELHDGPIQQLTVLGYGLERASMRFAKGDADGARQVLVGLQSGLSNEIGVLRRLMSELRPPALDEQGLAAAVKRTADDFADRQHVAATVNVSLRERIYPMLETTIYRVVQEALTNIGKHANAAHVDVSVWRDDDSVLLTVNDDGVGFDTTSVNGDGEHFGLFGIRQRVSLAGGESYIDSFPGAGTTVWARLPAVEGSGS